MLQVAQPGRQPVDAAVQAPDLGVEGVDEAPQQVFALVGELEAVGADTIGEDAERFAYSRDSFVAVPNVPGIELVAFGGGAVQHRVLADHRGGGLRLEGVVDVVHVRVSCLEWSGQPARCAVAVLAPAYVSLGHARAAEPPRSGRNEVEDPALGRDWRSEHVWHDGTDRGESFVWVWHSFSSASRSARCPG